MCQFEELWLPPAEREPVDALMATHTPALRLLPDPPMDEPDQDSMSRAHALIAAVAKAAVESLTGFRPLNQLTRWLDPIAIHGLSLAMRHGAWRGATVVRVRAEATTPTSIEGVAQIAITGRRVAVAIHLDLRHGHWVCTDLSVLLPGTHMVSRR